MQQLKLPLVLFDMPMATSIEMPQVMGGIDQRGSPEQKKAEHGRRSEDLDLTGTVSGKQYGLR